MLSCKEGDGGVVTSDAETIGSADSWLVGEDIDDSDIFHSRGVGRGVGILLAAARSRSMSTEQVAGKDFTVETKD